MLADEPNLRVYERAFTGRNSGKGGAPGVSTPIVLGARDFAPPALAATAPTKPQARARALGNLCARRWSQIPGPLATLAGLAALPVRVGWWALKRWFWTMPLALLLAFIFMPVVGSSPPRDVRFAEGEHLLQSAAHQYQRTRANGGPTNDDLVSSMRLRSGELRGRHYRVLRDVTHTADGFLLHALPTRPVDPVLVLHVPREGRPTCRQLAATPE